jgi:hypothetical protein
MAIITDINTAGASALTIKPRSKLMQVLLSGVWNGASVSVQKLVGAEWVTVASYTDSAFDIIETVGSGTYRTNTIVGGTAPVLVANIEFPHFSGGQVFSG